MTSDERFDRAVTATKRLLDMEPMGGNLHIQVGDLNLEDEFFEGPMKVWHPTVPEQAVAEAECYAALAVLSEDERFAAVRLAEGRDPD